MTMPIVARSAFAVLAAVLPAAALAEEAAADRKPVLAVEGVGTAETAPDTARSPRH
ncbi:hypothetical protein [Chelatococcus reniformis]|uniref:hypothetical protein n=1 Tax=Chelatococcus reniformis TaxID=1494448 RepID=UPI0016644B5D|nr:hypothetical protein [Chelatococcus reniformis]